jgi:sulfatase maturation enzyme AslB (radical SAM superfamily)
MEEFKLTHIDSFNDSYFLDNTWTGMYKKHSEKCHSCWVKPLCKFCPAREFLESRSYTLTDAGCNARRKMIEELIVSVVKLRNDSQEWGDFNRSLKEKTKAIEESREMLSAID